MAEVIIEAPANNFTVEMVTQGGDVPEVVRQLVSGMTLPLEASNGSDEELVRGLRETVDTSDLLEIGEGEELVYGYG